jgi:hypothetical protein
LFSIPDKARQACDCLPALQPDPDIRRPEQKNDLSESEPKVLRRMMMRFEELKRETGKKTNF